MSQFRADGVLGFEPAARGVVSTELPQQSRPHAALPLSSGQHEKWGQQVTLAEHSQCCLGAPPNSPTEVLGGKGGSEGRTAELP